MRVQDLLTHAERVSGGRVAVVDGGRTLTYRALGERCRRAAAGLVARGLGPGARVVVIADNTPAYLEAYFAIALAGLVAVPVNTRLSGAEVNSCLDDCGAEAVLFDRQYADRLPERAWRARVVLDAADADGWEALIEAHPPLAGSPGPRDEDALAHLFYTGGTTGRAKGVMLTHRNVVTSAMNKVVLGSFARDDVWLHAAPMFHQADAWAVLSFTALGAAHVFLPRFVAADALDLIERHRVTGFQLVPTMIFMMLDEPSAAARDLRCMRRILYGSAPMPTTMLGRAREVFGDVFQHIYGLTEAAGTVAATPWPALPEELAGARMASCGQPIPGVDMRIADDRGNVLPAATVGRIQVRGANVMRGYWQRPEETAAAFVDGWLDTGDVGEMDDDGFVTIVDRAKDMIITGGENVYSTEVENVLYGCAGVAEAAVVGLPDPRWGERVTAVLVPREGVSLDKSGILAHCRRALAGYKCPKSIEVLDALPKSAAGKILKHEVRAMLRGGSAQGAPGEGGTG